MKLGTVADEYVGHNHRTRKNADVLVRLLSFSHGTLAYILLPFWLE